MLYVLLTLAALVLLGALFAFVMAFYSPLKGQNETGTIPQGSVYAPYAPRLRALAAETEALPFESVSITARDGLRLRGRYYGGAEGAPLVIEFHGYRSRATLDFCGGTLLCRRLGCRVLLVDQRAHGRSEGHTITFGVKERLDCADWVEYAVERFGAATPILLSGISMGAATVLMAAGLPLPENVRGILADCGYTSPGEIIRRVIAHRGLPVGLTYFFLRLGARLYGGFDPESASAGEALRRCRVPVQLIHGEADNFVPCEMSRRLQEVCAAPCALFTVPNAGHGISYLVDPEGYTAVVEDFLRKTLTPAPDSRSEA